MRSVTSSPLSCEHSWHDRNASGQRVDHALVSGSLVDTVMACRYVHETRDLKLSDHSGLLLRLAAYERWGHPDVQPSRFIRFWRAASASLGWWSAPLPILTAPARAYCAISMSLRATRERIIL